MANISGELIRAEVDLRIAEEELRLAYQDAERLYRPRDPSSAYYGAHIMFGKVFFPFRETEQPSSTQLIDGANRMETE